MHIHTYVYLSRLQQENIQGGAITYTLSGRIGKVAASHAAVARSSPAEVALIYTCTIRDNSSATFEIPSR